MKFLNFKNSVTKRCLFSHIIVDYSQALLQAVIFAWNQMSVLRCINLMYNICHAKTYNINKLVTVHLCCSHFMHMVSRDVSQLNVTKVMRKRILMIMASLTNTTSYEEFKQNLCNRMIIFKSKRITNTVKKAVEDIDKEENIMEIPGNKPLDDSAIPINLPIYKSSKFYADGKEIEHSVNDIIMKESNIFADENPCYCEQFCKFFWIDTCHSHHFGPE